MRCATPIDDEAWQGDLEWSCRRVGVRRAVRLVASEQVEIPATTGVVRPAIIVPRAAASWSLERRRAVLLHELVHIVRLDWPLRVVARLARGIYWFNPLAWWAVRRLDLEQELACDEEVVALGTRPSVYACHLLGIARAVTRHNRPAAVSAAEMARACHLEERIMAILERTTPRSIGKRVLAPAVVLVAALVPALAAVAPVNAPDLPSPPPPTGAPAASAPANPTAPAPPTDLGAILEEMHAAEARLEPHLARIKALEVEMAPQLEHISDIDVTIDDEALAEIEFAMQPYLERIRDIELDMAPIEAEMAEVERRLQEVELHLDDGTLAEIERQIREQLEPLHEELERLHASMGPQLEQIEAIQREMEPIHQQLSAVHEQLEPQREELEKIHAAMEPFHQRMEAIHREMEPVHEELERLGQRLESALAGEVADVLRQQLGAVTGPQAPFDEAATRLLEDAHIDVRDDLVRIHVSASEARQILSDLMSPHRIGSQQAFDNAVASAVDAIASLEIPAR